jgi:hypothetical protein
MNPFSPAACASATAIAQMNNAAGSQDRRIAGSQDRTECRVHVPRPYRSGPHERGRAISPSGAFRRGVRTSARDLSAPISRFQEGRSIPNRAEVGSIYCQGHLSSGLWRSVKKSATRRRFGNSFNPSRTYALLATQCVTESSGRHVTFIRRPCRIRDRVIEK